MTPAKTVLSADIIIEMAKAKCLGYLDPPKKEKPLTAKQKADKKRARKIWLMIKGIAGCQSENAALLLDELTGVPVSKAKNDGGKGHIVTEDAQNRDWWGENMFRLVGGRPHNHTYLVVGQNTALYMKDDNGTPVTSGLHGVLRACDKKEIEAFFTHRWIKQMRAIGPLAGGLFGT